MRCFNEGNTGTAYCAEAGDQQDLATLYAYANARSHQRVLRAAPQHRTHTELRRIARGPPKRAEVAVRFLAVVLLATRERPAGVVGVADAAALAGSGELDDVSLAALEEAVPDDSFGIEDVGRVGVEPSKMTLTFQ